MTFAEGGESYSADPYIKLISCHEEQPKLGRGKLWRLLARRLLLEIYIESLLEF